MTTSSASAAARCRVAAKPMSPSASSSIAAATVERAEDARHEDKPQHGSLGRTHVLAVTHSQDRGEHGGEGVHRDGTAKAQQGARSVGCSGVPVCQRDQTFREAGFLSKEHWWGALIFVARY
jgi:hypothetical protein